MMNSMSLDSIQRRTDDAGVDTQVLRLADALDALASFLRTHGEMSWADWVADDARRVRRGDGYGVMHFLSAFGGMGSLNDVVIHAGDGNASTNDAHTLNDTLKQLRRSAYQQATVLRLDV